MEEIKEVIEQDKEEREAEHRTEGPEEQTGKKRSKVPAIIISSILGAAVVTYGGMCAVGSYGDTFRKNTVVNGVSLEGMNLEQAEAALAEAFSGATELDGISYSTIQVRPDIPDYAETFSVDVSRALVWDFKDTLQQAYETQRGGNFLLQGKKLVEGGGSATRLPYVEKGEALTSAIEATGILEVDTSVDGAYEIQEDRILVTKGLDGYCVDGEALENAIAENSAQGNYDPITCKVEDTTGGNVELQNIYDEVYTEKVEPTITVTDNRSYEVVPAVTGVSFDLEAAQTQLAAAAQGSEEEIALIFDDPSMTTEEYEEALFRDVLGQYTTDVSGSAARRSNVKLAGQKIDGFILMPGEEFAYNATVGQRTAAAGFKEAPAYQNGETVNELGGGVCQVSSTLYCACLYANLQITLRRNHTYVSSYVPLGMDATVSWGGPDYKFVNDTDYPILLKSYYESDRLTFKIMGTDVNHYKVKITSATLGTTPPSTKTEQDPTMEEGKSYTKTSGHTGYSVQTYRHVYDENDNLVWEGKEAYSGYSNSPKIVVVGTKKKAVVVTPSETASSESGAGNE